MSYGSACIASLRVRMRIWAISIHAPAEAIDFSQSLASRLHRSSQANVRYTTQRRVSTLKPFALSVRLTICNREFRDLAQGCPQLRTGITALGKDVPEPQQASEDGFESRHYAIAVLNVGAVDDDPNHQTDRIDNDIPLATFDLLASVIARDPAAFSRFDALTVDHSCRRRGFPSFQLSRLHNQMMVNPQSQDSRPPLVE